MLASNVRSSFAWVIKEGFQRQCYSWLFCSFLLLKKLCVLQSGIDKLLPRSRHAYLLAMPFFPLSKHQMQAAKANCHPPNPEMLGLFVVHWPVAACLGTFSLQAHSYTPAARSEALAQMYTVLSLSSLLIPVLHIFNHVSMSKLSPRARNHCCPQKCPVAFLGRWR